MLDRETLLKARLPEREITLEGVGELRVRALSRAEAMRLKEFSDKAVEGETLVLKLGVVDPVLSDDDVRAWRDVAPADEIETVLGAILDLSGLTPDEARSARFQLPARPGEAPRVSPGAGARDDRGAATG
jgi:hypothetical protein